MDLPGVPPPPPDEASRAASLAGDPRRWWALAVLLLAQTMIILDIAIVNVALPSAQADLHIAPGDVQWVLTAYVLPFGALLLLGGRIADYSGRKRVFAVATVGFAIASAIGGAAGSEGVLFAARALQGVFAAAMAPSLLSMITLGFPSGPDRTRAFSAFGGVSAASATFGLLLGGVVTEYLSWRWCLFINVPLSALVIAGAIPLLRESSRSDHPTYDLPGAALGSFALLGMIFGISRAADHGWGSPDTLVPLVTGVVVLLAFGVWELRASQPLLPLSLLRDRHRAGACLSQFLIYGAPTGITLLMLIFLQGPRGDTPIEAGIQFMPWPGAAILTAAACTRLLDIVPPRALLGAGYVVTAAGLLAFTRVEVTSTYSGTILPAMLILGVGSPVIFLAGNAYALERVPGGDSGVASAVVNTIQQVGAAVGVSALSTIAASAQSDWVSGHGALAVNESIQHGVTTAAAVGAVVMLAGGAVSVALIRPRSRRRQRALAPALVER